MRILNSTIHPDIHNLTNKTVLKRLATRAIVTRGTNILLLYTKRYDDYSLPGGGVDKGEDILDGLKRELQEETGAQGVKNIKPFGIYEEFRPWYKPEHDILHMLSYCYQCEIDEKLGSTNYETYEINNGMKALWVDINRAISHNQHVLMNSEKKGLSIEREIFLLNIILKEIVLNN